MNPMVRFPRPPDASAVPTHPTLFLSFRADNLVVQLNPEARASLPALAFNSFVSRFKEPELSEGFQDIVEIEFAFKGSREEYAIWAKYWL